MGIQNRPPFRCVRIGLLLARVLTETMRLHEFCNYPTQDEVAAVEDWLSWRCRDRGSDEAREARSITVPEVDHGPIIEAWVGGGVCAQVRVPIAILVDPEVRLRVADGGAESAEAAIVARVGGRAATSPLHGAPSATLKRDEELGTLFTLLHVIHTPGAA